MEVLPPPQSAFDWQRFKSGLRYKGRLFVRVVGWYALLRELIEEVALHGGQIKKKAIYGWQQFKSGLRYSCLFVCVWLVSKSQIIK